jgi:hypothetical protein
VLPPSLLRFAQSGTFGAVGSALRLVPASVRGGMTGALAFRQTRCPAGAAERQNELRGVVHQLLADLRVGFLAGRAPLPAVGESPL